MSFSSQACSTSNKHDVYYISEFSCVIPTTTLQMLSFRLFFMQGFLTYTLSFNLPHKWKLHSWDLANEATVPCLLLCDLKNSVNSAQNCLLCEMLHCLGLKRLRLSHNQTNVQKWLTYHCEFVISKEWGKVPSHTCCTPHAKCNSVWWQYVYSEALLTQRDEIKLNY
jgi:hypothetical protein